MMRKVLLINIFTLVCFIMFSGCGSNVSLATDSYPQTITMDSIPDGSTYTYICRPPGQGPFPAVLYNHGGLGQNIGGDLRGTCLALAEAGYLTRAEKRQETVPLTRHLDEVLTALTVLQSHPDADPNKFGIVGYSRGGLLTLQAAIQRPNEIDAVILMAPAAGGNALNDALQQVSAITAPVLIQVANNDLYQDNHVQLATDVYNALIAQSKTVTLTIYPDYDSDENGTIDANDDGH